MQKPYLRLLSPEIGELDSNCISFSRISLFTESELPVKCIATSLHKNCVTTDFIQHISTTAQHTKHNSIRHCKLSPHTCGSCDQGGVKASLQHNPLFHAKCSFTIQFSMFPVVLQFTSLCPMFCSSLCHVEFYSFKKKSQLSVLKLYCEQTWHSYCSLCTICMKSLMAEWFVQLTQ